MTNDIERLRKAVAIAATIFREYERLHMEKRTLDGDAKALRNGQYAEEMEAALDTLTPSAGEGVEGDERDTIVQWLRAESDKGADIGIAAEKGTTRRAAYGGGSLALAKAADAIERGEHLSAALLKARSSGKAGSDAN